MLFDKELFKKIITWILLLFFPSIIVPVLYFCANLGLSNSFLVPTIIILVVPIFVFILRAGTFDLFRYQFINWGSTWRKGEPKRYKDYYQYKEEKQSQRESHKFYYLPYLVIGLILLVLTIAFAIYVI